MPARLDRRVVRSVLFVVLVFAVGAAGVFVGSVVRTRLPGRSSGLVETRVPTSLLKVGNPFPDAAVIDEEGRERWTGELLASGGVVLFLDLECPPCTDAALRWQRAVDDGVLPEDQLVAITYHARETTRAYQVEHGLRFPIMRDSLMTFRSQYEVDRFPLQVVVGRSGTIRSASYDTETPIDPAALARDLDD